MFAYLLLADYNSDHLAQWLLFYAFYLEKNITMDTFLWELITENYFCYLFTTISCIVLHYVHTIAQTSVGGICSTLSVKTDILA